MRSYFLPAILSLFAVVSLTTLRSIVPDLVYKQALAFALAGGAFIAAWKIPFSWHLRFASYLYWLLLLALLFLLLYGSLNRGIAAWISLPFGFKFQPSQLAVPIVALYVARFFRKPSQFSGFFLGQVLLLIFLPFVLVLAQPDFGTALVFGVAMSTFLIFNHLSYAQVFNLAAVATLAFALLWFIVFKDYQRDRLLGFFRLHQSDVTVEVESSSAYNARQALIAIGSGQLYGRGIGQGVQSHLRFLPERQTDFIFASFVEEWGFLGAFFLLGLYFALLYFLWHFSAQGMNFQEQLYALSLLLMFLVQLLINVGMNLAIMPITGITLPFLSYGGSSVIALFYALGVIQSIVSRLPREAKRSFY